MVMEKHFKGAPASIAGAYHYFPSPVIITSSHNQFF
jgi:hypothetical protein